MIILIKCIIYVILVKSILCSYGKFNWRKTPTGKGYVAFGSLAEPAKWTWMAALLIEDSGSFYHQCGGSLVSDQHIVTAAHCLINNGTLRKRKSVIVRLGQYDLRKKAKDFRVRSYSLHPKFNKKTLENDVAVIKLAKKVNFTKEITTIKFAMVNGNYSFERENGSEIALIAGWGRTAFNGEFSDDLIEARLHVFPHSECLKALEAYTKITAQHICAKAPYYSPQPSDACPGDSGGPLVQLDEKSEQYILTGVISFGKRCALRNFPGVYARVDYFSDWIKEKLKHKRSRS